MVHYDKIKYVTPEEAYRHMTNGAQQRPVTPADAENVMFGAEAARKEMLARHGIANNATSASAAREKVIERQRGKK